MASTAQTVLGIALCEYPYLGATAKSRGDIETEQCRLEPQGPNAEAALEYGKLLEQLGNAEEALQKYRQGLMQVIAVEKYPLTH